MKLALCAAFVMLSFLGTAQANFLGPGSGGSGGGSGCAQATTVLARSELAGLTSTDRANYTNFICGLVTDGTITGNLSTTGCSSTIEAIYVPGAAPNATAARINLCSTTNFNATVTGSPVFIPGSGYAASTANANDGLDTHFIPASSSIYTLDAAHVSMWTFTNSVEAGGAPGAMIGVRDFSRYVTILPRLGGDFSQVWLNTADQSFAILSSDDSSGFWVSIRRSATATDVYRNDQLIGTSPSLSNTPLSSTSIYLGGMNTESGCCLWSSTRPLAMATIGGPLSFQRSSLFARGCALFTAVRGSPTPECVSLASACIGLVNADARFDGPVTFSC
jgi:hypothetical protein